MNSNPSREELAKNHAAKYSPSVDAVAGVAVALLNSHAVFRFLTETFAALDSGQVDLTLSSDAAGGLSHICEQAAGELLTPTGACKAPPPPPQTTGPCHSGGGCFLAHNDPCERLSCRG